MSGSGRVYPQRVRRKLHHQRMGSRGPHGPAGGGCPLQRPGPPHGSHGLHGAPQGPRVRLPAGGCRRRPGEGALPGTARGGEARQRVLHDPGGGRQIRRPRRRGPEPRGGFLREGTRRLRRPPPGHGPRRADEKSHAPGRGRRRRLHPGFSGRKAHRHRGGGPEGDRHQGRVRQRLRHRGGLRNHLLERIHDAGEQGRAACHLSRPHHDP